MFAFNARAASSASALAFAASFLAPFVLTATAQSGPLSADPDQKGETVIVTAVRDPEDPPVVAEARERLSETPGAVAVVSNESYASRFAPGLVDILRDVPGVFIQKKWGGDTRLSIRGSGIGNNNHLRGTLLAQDGMPLNEADGFGDTQLIDPFIARYTEVYKGGNALRYGGALLGGAINVITPNGKTIPEAELSVSRGATMARCAATPAAAASGIVGTPMAPCRVTSRTAGANRAKGNGNSRQATSGTRSATTRKSAPLSAAATSTSRFPDRFHCNRR